MATAATYTKLKNGNWGLRVATESVVDGQSVTVTKKSGETETKIVAKVLWRGNGIALCAIAAAGKSWDPDKYNGRGARTGGFSRACKTGGNCSSFGSGHSCGGHDCDGF